MKPTAEEIYEAIEGFLTENDFSGMVFPKEFSAALSERIAAIKSEPAEGAEEIIKRYCDCTDAVNVPLIVKMMNDFAALAVAEATQDCYPKEFLLWMGAECPYDYHSSHKIWIHDMDRKTTDELFNYWKENVK